MVVRIRLARLGGRNDPFYRIVVAHCKSRRDGKHIEALGTYDPICDDHGIKHINVNVERAKYWLSVGAQPTDTVKRLFSKGGIIPKLPKTWLPSTLRSAAPTSSSSRN
ncbi:30S ribosomal protein S16 [Paraphysoderma sedebokerense]|nr:30S ribosomal protein S16 [Paraphysoderma sedebokerense]